MNEICKKIFLLLTNPVDRRKIPSIYLVNNFNKLITQRAKSRAMHYVSNMELTHLPRKSDIFKDLNSPSTTAVPSQNGAGFATEAGHKTNLRPILLPVNYIL